MKRLLFSLEQIIKGLTLSIVLLLFAQLLKAMESTERPALQLANRYHDGIKLEDYWVSEKLDGVRAFWDGQNLISKQGNIFAAPEWFIQALPSFPLDGELWLERGKFSELSGIVRKHVPIEIEWRRVSYQIFDYPVSSLDFDSRLRFLRGFFSNENETPWLKLIPQYKVKDEAELKQKLDAVEHSLGEGLMLHKSESFYHAGRDDGLLKLKSYADAEAVVLAHQPGKGKYEGKTGALLVKAVNGSQINRLFKLGTGLSDYERAHPPEIGSLVTYKYFGFTSTGLPRFASFMRVRE